MFIVPQGFSDLLPEKAEVFYFVKKKLATLFRRHGFLPVVPPSIELLDIFVLSGESEKDTFNFIDHSEEKTACFRYDFTPQVARIIANHTFPFPAKFFYDGVVLRNSKRLSGENREIYQSGIEIIGDDTIFADLELIVLSDKIFKTLDIKKYKIFLSDAGIIRSLFMKSSGEIALPQELKDAFVDKDISRINAITKKINISNEKRRFLADLPLMCGDLKLISEIENNYKIKEVKSYLTRLKKIGKEAEKLGIYVEFDLGEVRGFEYHTGVILDSYAIDEKEIYHEVITGGRYDNLLTAYLGQSVPATGFAVDINELCDCVDYCRQTNMLIVRDNSVGYSEVYQTAELFRKQNVNVNILNTDDAKSLLANDSQHDFVLFFGSQGIKIINCKNNEERVVKKITSDFVHNFLKYVVK